MGQDGRAPECAVAQFCREAGGRVSINVMMRDLDIPGPHAAVDGRRFEVIADGIPLFDGAQFALDTSMVSSIHCDGTAKRGASARCGVARRETAEGKDIP